MKEHDIDKYCHVVDGVRSWPSQNLTGNILGELIHLSILIVLCVRPPKCEM